MSPPLNAMKCARAYQLILDGHDKRSRDMIKTGSLELLRMFGYSDPEREAASQTIADSYLSHAQIDDGGERDPILVLEYFLGEVQSKIEETSYLLKEDSKSPYHKASWWAYYLIFQRTGSALQLFKALFHLYKELESSYGGFTALRCVPYLVLGDRLGHHRKNSPLAQ